MKPIVLTPERRQELERRRKATLDRRVYQRLTAVLAVAAGKTREEVAALLGVSLSQLGEWLRVYRREGLDALCALHSKGDPGKLTPAQLERLRAEVATGRFRNSDQIRAWIEEASGVAYSRSGVKDLLRRCGVSYHQVTGFLWKADPDRQKAFVRKHRRQKARARRQGGRPAAPTSMPATRSGGWSCSSPAGCWWGSASWWAWAAGGSG